MTLQSPLSQPFPWGGLTSVAGIPGGLPGSPGGWRQRASYEVRPVAVRSACPEETTQPQRAATHAVAAFIPPASLSVRVPPGASGRSASI